MACRIADMNTLDSLTREELVGIIVEIRGKIEGLEGRISTLEQENERLRTENEELRSRLGGGTPRAESTTPDWVKPRG